MHAQRLCTLYLSFHEPSSQHAAAVIGVMLKEEEGGFSTKADCVPITLTASFCSWCRTHIQYLINFKILAVFPQDASGAHDAFIIELYINLNIQSAGALLCCCAKDGYSKVDIE